MGEGIDELSDVQHTRDALMELGIRLCDHEGKPTEALHCFEILLAQDPWDALSLNNKAHCLRALNRVDEARATSVAAITIAPRFAQAWCTLGEIQAMADEKTSARLSFEIALELADGKPFAAAIREHMTKL